MHKFVLSHRALTAAASVLVFVSPAMAQQQPAQPNIPQQTQAVPQPNQMPQGAWPGAMPGPMHRGMMQPGQAAGPQNMQQPQGGPGMMHRGMPMQQQGAQGQGQPGMQQGAPGMMDGQRQQGPMMRGPMMGRYMQGPMMYGPGMHHAPMGGPMMGGPMIGGMCPMGGPDFAEGRLAFLKAELGITQAQQAAFDAFAKVVKSHAEGRQESHHAMMQTMSQAQTLLDRLGASISMMEMRIGTMKEMNAALDKLYGALSDEQKLRADFLLPGMGGMRCFM